MMSKILISIYRAKLNGVKRLDRSMIKTRAEKIQI